MENKQWQYIVKDFNSFALGYLPSIPWYISPPNLIHNPKKLGAMALEQQIQTLCYLIDNVDANGGPANKSLNTKKCCLWKCQKEEEEALRIECHVNSKLKIAKNGLAALETNDNFKDLTSCFSKASTEAKSLQRQRKAGNVVAKK